MRSYGCPEPPPRRRKFGEKYGAVVFVFPSKAQENQLTKVM